MATATIGDIYKRLRAIEERLQTATFEGRLTAGEKILLESEAENIRVVLVREASKATGEDPKVIYEKLDSVRQLNLIAEMARRGAQNFPDNAVANQAVQDWAQGKISPEQFTAVMLPMAYGVPPKPPIKSGRSILVDACRRAWQGIKPK